jgi:hypothetical protein
MALQKTQKENFKDIIKILETMDGTQNLIDFCEDRIEKLSRKSATDKKVNAENEEIKETILDILTRTNCEHTISELNKYEELREYVPQKLTNLVTQLKKAGLVENIKSGGKSYYRIAKAE